jgi:hypothetical protein
VPKINQQSPRPTPNRTQPTGSILSRAVPVAEVGDDSIKIVLYGQNRVGKTYLACQFPKPLLLVDMEPNSKGGGSRTVRRVQGVTYLKVTTSKDAIALAHELKGGEKFQTVVVDSATGYQDLILREILELPKVPEMLSWGMVSRDHYRARSEKTREALRPFLDLDCHVVITAKEKDHNPPDRDKPEIIRGSQLESFFASDLGGATVGWLHDACDYICRLYIEKEVVRKKVRQANQEIEVDVETGKNVRRLRTMYHPNFAAGFRSEFPDRVPEYIQDPTFDKIHRVIKGEKQEGK